jgi:hypothetical protein
VARLGGVQQDLHEEQVTVWLANKSKRGLFNILVNFWLLEAKIR